MDDKSTDDLIGELMSKPSFEAYLHANEPFFSERGVAELLAQLYETKDLTKAELARRASISEVYLHQVFAGGGIPPGTVCCASASAWALRWRRPSVC